MSTLTNCEIKNLPVEISQEMLAELQLAYRTPPRAYHSFQHVLEVLKHFDSVIAGPGWLHPREVFLAILFHDAVYTAGRKDNEALSAGLASKTINAFLTNKSVDLPRVTTLIELTARHGSLESAALEPDAAHFLDCDMAIVGADEATFEAYDAAIETEYRGIVPRVLFQMGRKRFFKKLLEAPRIFHSQFFHERFDARARQNIGRALGL